MEHIDSYADALRRGWTGDTGNTKRIEAELKQIADDPELFLASKDDQQARGAAIEIADGIFAPRIPGYYRWMWDGEVSGSLNFRWQEGTTDLPPYCLGHIGYSVAPWKQNLGYATEALKQILIPAKERDMPFVELTTDIDNFASQKVIQNNGGLLIEEFSKIAEQGGAPSYRWRIYF